MATVGSLCHQPGTQLFLLRPADPPCAAGGRPTVHRGVVWLLGTLGVTSTLHGPGSMRETGACTVSKAPKGGLAVGGYPEEQRLRT